MIFDRRAISVTPLTLAAFLLLSVFGCSSDEPSPSTAPTPAPVAKAKENRAPGGPMGIPSNPKIREAMDKIGKGDSALATTIGKALESEKPDWEAVGGQTKEFVQLASGLGNETPTKGEKETWAKFSAAFLKSAESLGKSVGSKDLTGAKAAHAVLAGSCMECHRIHRAMPGGRGQGGPPRGAIKGPSPLPGSGLEGTPSKKKAAPPDDTAVPPVQQPATSAKIDPGTPPKISPPETAEKPKN